MLNDILLSFFFGMPAVVVIFLSKDLSSPPARAILFWGGVVATALVAIVVVPMFLCDGALLRAYTTCLGGSGMAALFNGAEPVIRAAAFTYILAGPPLAILAYLVEWLAGRQRT